MTGNFPLFLITLSFLLLGCNRNDGSDATNNSNQNIHTLVHDDETREYILYIPNSYDGTSEMPLLINFHGFDGDMNEYMKYADMRSLAEAENFILVYPQGTLIDGYSHWNAALDSPDNKSDADDLGFIEVLIDKLSKDYMIDLERIYACGYSNGAMFSYALACYKSNLIAAVGSVSGAMLDTKCTTSHPMPVVIIHGTKDGVLPYDGSSEYKSIETVLNFWKNFNNTGTIPVLSSVNDDGTTIEHYQYNQGNKSVSVEHYKIIGGDHEWFDINYEGSNTSGLIWNFVSRYDINGLR
jgi:polyhydroxybutyrate depolymerase